MNLRTMNQGMLLVYAIVRTYLALVTALYASEDSSENKAKTTITSTQDSEEVTTNTTVGTDEDLTDEEKTDKEVFINLESCKNAIPGSSHQSNRSWLDCLSKEEDTSLDGTPDEARDKSGHSHGHSLTSSEEGAATTVMKILAHTTLVLTHCSSSRIVVC